MHTPASHQRINCVVEVYHGCAVGGPVLDVGQELDRARSNELAKLMCEVVLMDTPGNVTYVELVARRPRYLRRAGRVSARVRVVLLRGSPLVRGATATVGVRGARAVAQPVGVTWRLHAPVWLRE